MKNILTTNKSSTRNFQNARLMVLYHIILIVCLLYLLYNSFNRHEKIAYVDSGRIMSEYKGANEAKKEYQQKAKVWQSNIDTLSNEVRTAIQGYEKSLATMPKKEQELAKQLIQAKQRQLTEYQRAIQDNAKQEDAKLTQGVVSQINGFLSSYGKAHQYKLILIANQSGTIAYAQEGLDITKEVIDELNANFSPGRK